MAAPGRRRAKPKPVDRARRGFEGALRDLTAFLDRPGVHGAVIGGIAVIARGVARVTADIDVAVIPPAGGPAAILKALESSGFVPRIERALAFAEENLVLLVRHDLSGVDVDVSLAHLQFEQEAIAAAEQVPFGRVRIPVPRATDLVVYKMIAARPTDLQDVETLLAGGANVDRARVLALLREFDELLGLERVLAWERLLTRLDLGV